MDQAITLSLILQIVAVVVAVWGGIKAVTEIVKAINKQHDRAQKWDGLEEKMLQNLQVERDKIYVRYDSKLEEMEKRIEENHDDIVAQNKELKDELYILTECMAAVLSGLREQGCNGPVSEASDMLNEYLRKRAHE